MKRKSNIVLMEDWEHLGHLDKLYLQEDEEQMMRDLQYAEFIRQHEGKIIVETDEKTGKETKEVVIRNSVLPF